MEKLSILDVLLTYKNDSDKIAILGKAIEMIIDYFDSVSASYTNLSENMQNIARVVTLLDDEIKRIEEELMSLRRNITANISKLEDTVTTSVSKLEDTVKGTTQRTPGGAVATSVAAAPVQRTRIVEENLMRPSQIGRPGGGAPPGPGPAPLGGGMSIRSAMMAEIKQRIHGPGGAEAPGSPVVPTTPGTAIAPGVPTASSAGQSSGEMGGGYLPKIQQPKEAKSLEGGLVSKMNKLLDTKFQQMTPTVGAPPSGPPSAMAPPRAPPSAPPMAPSFAPPSKKEEKKPDKKKEEKKPDKKKEKDKSDSQLTDIEKKIREKLG